MKIAVIVIPLEDRAEVQDLIGCLELLENEYKKQNFTMVQNLANNYSECRGYPIFLAQRCLSEFK